MTTEAPAKVVAESATPTTTITEAPAAEAPKTAEQEAAEDAEFGAGFKQVHEELDTSRAESRPANEPAKVEPPKPAAKVETPAPAAPAKVEDKVVFEGLTESQLKAAVAKAGEVDNLKKQIATNHDKVMGTFGELRSAVTALKANPSTQSVKVTRAALKRLDAEGFGELADALAADLEGLAVGDGNTSTFDQTAFDKSVEERVAAATDKLERSTEKKLLAIAHPDWNACFHAEDFKAWRATLPAEGQQVIDHSWDSTALSGALTDFKEWRAKAEKAKADSDAKAKADAAAAEAAKKRQQRIEGAITPQGGGQAPSAPTDDDAFLEGYAKARATG